MSGIPNQLKSSFLLLLFLFILLNLVLFIVVYFLQVSPVALFVATIAHSLVGLFWYSPFGGGRYLEYETSPYKLNPLHLIGSFLLSFLFTATFGMVLGMIEPPSLLLSTVMAIIAWSVFSVSPYLRTALWRKDGKGNCLIHMGGDLIKFVVTALILTALSSQ